MGNIILHDKEFRPFIEATKIDQVITRMAEQMNRELADTPPLFLSILNGSFMFTSDLIKQIVIPGTQISFVKVASYSGTCSTGAIQELIGLKEDIQNRTVVILEDIIDSGRSMKHLLEYLHAKNPKQVIVATLFHKPKAAVWPYKTAKSENVMNWKTILSWAEAWITMVWEEIIRISIS